MRIKKSSSIKIYLPQVGEGQESEDEQEEFYKKFSKEVKIDPANKPDADRYTVIVEGTSERFLLHGHKLSCVWLRIGPCMRLLIVQVEISR